MKVGCREGEIIDKMAMMMLIQVFALVFSFIEATPFQSKLQRSASRIIFTRTALPNSVHTDSRLRHRFPAVPLPSNKNDQFSKDVSEITRSQNPEASGIKMKSNENTGNKHVPFETATLKMSIQQSNITDEKAEILQDNNTTYLNENMHVDNILNVEKNVSLGIYQTDDLTINKRITDKISKENKSPRRQRMRTQNYSSTSKITAPPRFHAPAGDKVHDFHYGERFIQGKQKCACAETKCDFSSCGLTSVPQDLPPNITDLQLDTNEIKTLTTDSFLRYGNLEYLYLSYNSMTSIEDYAFSGLSQLIVLDLSSNLLGNNASLSVHIFEPLKSLRVLRLIDNDFPCKENPPHPDLILAYLHNLTELYIDNYGDQEYGPGFRNMTSLRNLTFSCQCPIDHLSNTSFKNVGQITLLSIRRCDIHGVKIDSHAFSHLANIRTLDISENREIGIQYMPVILHGLERSNLQTLIMDKVVSEFSINFINSSLTQILPASLTSLSARFNNILFIDNDGIKSLPKRLKRIDLSDNYMIMDPEEIALEAMEGLESLYINSNSEECLTGTIEMYHQNILKDFEFYQSENKTRQDKYELRINNDPKSVGARIPWNLRRVQVSLKIFPDVYLSHIDDNNNLEELDLRCSLLLELNFYSLLNFPHLTLINAASSSIQLLILDLPIISPVKVLILVSNNLDNYLNKFETPFEGLNNLVYLDISLNHISNLPLDLFYGLDQLQHILLHGNTFSRFGANISHIEHLKLLDVTNTGLSTLPHPVRSHIDHLCRIKPVQLTVKMTGCPIQCDCFNLDFLKWMVKSPAFHEKFIGYMCRYSDNSIKEIYDGYEATIRDLDRECAKNYPLFLLVLAATLILLSAAAGTIIYRFRWKIRYLYYAAYLKVMDKHKKDNNHPFTYDVFLSYDSEDQAFVTRCLSPELENRGLKLLIHARDFVAGTYIASNIVMAVAESRKTLVVLTHNFLESTWCNYELQMATMEAVHTGRQVLVFLLKEDIPNRELDVELLRYIQTNTYLPYPGPEDEGDEEIMKRFYDKLAHDLKG